MRRHSTLDPALALAACLTLGATWSLAAQEAPAVRPGGVATLTATAGQAGTGDSLAYVIRPAPGVRLFIPPTGTVGTVAGQPIRVPITVGVPAGAPAGHLVVADVELAWGGAREEIALAVQVMAIRGIEFLVDTDLATAVPGATIEIDYRLRNRGNAPDTFRIDVAAPSTWPGIVAPPVQVVAAGQTATGVIRVRLGGVALRGEEHLIRVTAEGRGVRQTQSTRVVVVGEESRMGNLATVPGSVFVGSSTGPGTGGPDIALTAAGEVRPGTQVSVDVRHVDQLSPAAAFRGALSGPRLRVGIDAPSWSARAGDVFVASDLVTGPFAHGRGVQGSASRGGVAGEAIGARPWSYHGGAEDGHILRASGRYRTGLGTFGATVGSMRRQDAFLGAYSQAGGMLTYRFQASGHRVQAEAGVMRVGSEDDTTSGAAGEVRYFFDRGRLSVAAHARKVPATTNRTSSHGDEVFASTSVLLTTGIAATGWVYATEAPLVTGGPHTASRGGAGGFRIRLPYRASARILGTYRANEVIGGTMPTRTTRSIRVGGNAPVAGIVLEGDLETGTTGLDVDRPFRSAGIGGRWNRNGQWAWAGITHYDVGLGPALTSLDLNGSVRFLGAELQGGLNNRLNSSDLLAATTFWSSASVPVRAMTRVMVGIEHRGASLDSPWRFALGASRSLAVPLPYTRAPVLRGVVFEDLDGDGVRGPGEPVLAGVEVIFGALRATTDADGAFRFYDTGRGLVSLDPTRLPAGYVVPLHAPLPTHGHIEIPVIRAGAIQLRVFLDRDGDGAMDAQDRYAAGVIVSVIDRNGTPRDAVTDPTGSVRFGGLAPGTYTVMVRRPAPDGRPVPPVHLEVTVEPGKTVDRLVALPLRTMEIRMPNGASR